jgi:hypothetical protein
MPAQSPSAAAILRAELQSAHRLLETTMADVTDEIANRPAPGNANPIGASYAHAVIAEDGIVNGMLRGQPPLILTTWAGRTGTDKIMPMPGVAKGDIGAWYHSVRVDLTACRAYAQAVYAQSEEFIGNADDATLGREIDLSMIGLGKLPLAVVFGLLVTGHLNNLCGEISAIKGVNGLRGYPF